MLPVFPLKAVLLPSEHMELRIFEPRYHALLESCMSENKPFIVAFCEDHDDETGTLSSVGCEAHIIKTTPYEDGSFRVVVEGGLPVYLNSVNDSSLYLQASVEEVQELKDLDDADTLLETAASLIEIYRELLTTIEPDMVSESFRLPLRAEDAFRAATHILMPENKKQELLETPSMRQRYDLLVKDVQIEIERLRFLLSDQDSQAEVLN